MYREHVTPSGKRSVSAPRRSSVNLHSLPACWVRMSRNVRFWHLDSSFLNRRHAKACARRCINSIAEQHSTFCEEMAWRNLTGMPDRFLLMVSMRETDHPAEQSESRGVKTIANALWPLSV